MKPADPISLIDLRGRSANSQIAPFPPQDKRRKLAAALRRDEGRLWFSGEQLRRAQEEVVRPTPSKGCAPSPYARGKSLPPGGGEE